MAHIVEDGPKTPLDIILTAAIVFLLIIGVLITTVRVFAIFVIPVMALFGKGAAFLLWLIPAILVISIAIAIWMWVENKQ